MDDEQPIVVVSWLTGQEKQQFEEEYRRLGFDFEFAIANVFLVVGIERYNLEIQRKHLPVVLSKINEVMERVRPVEPQITKLEMDLVGYVKEMVATNDYEWSRETKSPLYRLCLNWAFGDVEIFLQRFKLLRQLDFWVDGVFVRTCSPISPSRIELQGHCLCGRGSDVSNYEGPFEA